MTTFNPMRLRRRLGALFLAACQSSCPPAMAAPSAPQVVAGQATFSQQGNVFSITNTPGAIINWQSFNINAGEITRFVQQSGDSAVLNRVLGQDPTTILGTLQSNGKVFLINPNGILFGQGARVDVNGLVASTMDILDADFKAGRMNFNAGASAGAVHNDGAITTPQGGKVFLLAPNVENNGIIDTPGGDVILAAGHSVQLVDSNDPALHVVVSAPDDQALNLGQVIAQGGRIGILGALVGQRGLVNADSVVRGADGKIVFKASRAARLGANSVTSAVGSVGQGGEIRVLGPAVDIDGGARVDASGAIRGGTVLVGGDWQGADGTPRALQTTMAAGASIRADATRDGDGGKVVLWSDNSSTVRGSLSAQGAGAGHGGNIETSGHVLDADGVQVDARGGALPGTKNGSWLLDSYDIEVVSTGTAATGDVSALDSGATRIEPATLAAAGADLVLQARHDLTVTDAIGGAGSVHAGAGHDIKVNAQVSGQGDLDFRAANAFVLGQGGLLKTGNDIDIQANTVARAGGIAGNGGQNPALSLTSADPDRAIALGGQQDANALWLDAATLGLLSGKIFAIKLGNSQHTGLVTVASDFTAAASLVLEGAGTLAVRGKVDLTANPASRFIAGLVGDSGQIQVTKPIMTSSSVLLQGDRMSIGAQLGSASVGLMPNNTGTAISVGGAGGKGGLWLGQAALNQVKANTLTIGGLSGGHGALSVDGAVSLTGSGPARLVLDAGAGALGIAAPLTVGGALELYAAGIKGSGVIQASTLSLWSSAGIGSADSPLRTRAGSILALNQGSGSQPINIANQGALMLLGAVQDGDANRGAIMIDSVGGMTIPAYAKGSDGGPATGEVRTGSGDISLTTHSPMDIAGHVATTGGNVRLLADNGGKLTIRPNASVSSGTGDVNISAGSTDIASGAVQVSRPDKLHVATGGQADTPGTPTPPAPPTIQACLANRGAAGCGAVLDKAVQACVANPDGPLCGQVLPSLAVCQAAPATTGCSVVLARNDVDQCLANPALSNCGTKLPAYDVCTKAPSTYGCGQVIQHHDAVTACIANPAAPGCAATLPTLATCRLDAGVYGCAPVLARAEFEACVANPGLPGCSSILPPLIQCKATPALEGCAQVLQLTFQACLANPHDAGCGGILPTLGECVSSPGKNGCDAVLPTLNQCIGSPSLQGCEVRLPTLTQCAVLPSTPGCEAVLPTASFCSVHPGDASCVIFSGNGGDSADPRAAPVAHAVQATVHLIDTGTAESQQDGSKARAGAERLAGPAQAQLTSAKNEKPATRTYCN